MHCDPILLPTLVNKASLAQTMVDTGCLCYGLCDPKFATQNRLKRIGIKPFFMEAFDGEKATRPIREVAVADLDFEGYQERVWMYVTPLGGYDMYLGMPWIRKRGVQLDQKGERLRIRIGSHTVNIRTEDQFTRDTATIQPAKLVSAVAWNLTRKGSRKAQVFAASMADINQALRTKIPTDPRTKLPQHYSQFLDVFDRKKADTLPEHRGPSVDHRIELERTVDGKEPEVPWGPLYGMSRDELLVLRKTLNELLDKGFIRVSNSPASAPILFVKKPGGGLRFCVDYRALNKLTRKDRYPLPLIQETLRNLSEARIFTKLDVIAAFHRIRIAKGDEWKTAFRTRFGLYEWMVTPFGLANAPSTFQRYINWTLRDLLDDFCSAYIDDVIIYSKNLREHRKQVEQVLKRLRSAGLQCDIDKCEFEVETVKYLGYIVEAGKGIRMDPEKVKAIQNWQAPTTTKGVRSFLGFANFYRRFIGAYSDIARPLTELTHKDQVFQWSKEAEAAFQELKRIFVLEPTLVRFDPERRTRIETDSSGWCVGATFLQLSPDGIWRPYAFFSRKLSPPECNYEIHDKEMLAIIRSLEEWDAELRSVGKFEILTDHKNLEYFMTIRKLSERQMRWSLVLSRFNFQITHVSGPSNARADALSRRDQDIPKDSNDDRLQERNVQLIKPEWVKKGLLRASATTPLQVTQRSDVGEEHSLSVEWPDAIRTDSDYQTALTAVQEGRRKFPAELRLKISIGECSSDSSGRLTFRGRIWVPSGSNLRTKLLQTIHDSQIHAHPGREALFAIIARRFFWPGLSRDIRTFTGNCDQCGSNKTWRTLRYGLLKPLPIPNRIWSEISMDFITGLPMSQGCTNMIVITDRLSKGVVADGLPDLETETVLNWFLKAYYPHHFLPRAIVSDRGSQFVSALWKRVCDKLQIQRRLSTAFSPETDGSTERANEVIEATLRTLIGWAQDDWLERLPIVIAAICSRESKSTRQSPFFVMHGWHPEAFEFEPETDTTRDSPVARADAVLAKLKSIREFTETMMASAQEQQEKAANRNRIGAPSYQVGDKVWLDLKHISTDRPSKKLDHQYAKYTVTEIVGTHNYRLDTPPGIHNVFHTKRLRPVLNNPLPGQIQHEPQPIGITTETDQEYEVEQILKEKKGRGGARKYLVKWVGYQKPTWEPYDFVKDLAALSIWEANWT